MATARVQGTRSDKSRVLVQHVGYSPGAVTAGQYLLEFPVNFPCRIGGIVARAEVAGTGAGNTVIDVLKNGVSLWAAPGDRPTLPAASTGEFVSQIPQRRALTPKVPMDALSLRVAGIPASTGHARVSVAVVLEKA